MPVVVVDVDKEKIKNSMMSGYVNKQSFVRYIQLILALAHTEAVNPYPKVKFHPTSHAKSSPNAMYA